MRNKFTKETYDLFRDVPCYECGHFHANCLHHIMKRISNSPYNAAPLNNQACHLNKGGKMGRGDLAKKEIRLDFLEKTSFYLFIYGYERTRKDEEFIDYVITKYPEAKNFYKI